MAMLFPPPPIKTPMLDRLGIPNLPWKKFFQDIYNLVGGSSSSSTSIPAGTISAYGGTSAPDGWLLCDGTSYAVGSYSSLHNAIGDAFGGDGGTNFNVPDLRGRFLRGVDGSAGRDPDDATRTAMNTGGNTGDNVGSIQTEAYKQHTHAIADPGHTHSMAAYTNGLGGVAAPQGGVAFTNPLGNIFNTNSATTGISANNSGGNETRPINAAVNFIIKT